MFNRDLKFSSYSKLFLCLILGISTKFSVAQLNVDSQIRPRFEYRNGYGKLPDKLDIPAYFVNQRSRLTVDYQQPSYKSVFSIQDVRVWGDATNYSATGIQGSDASIDLYQAWFEWIFTPGTSISIGRECLSYDDQRLISQRNWNANGISYDALVLKTRLNSWDAHLGLSLNNNKENKYGNLYNTGKMKTMNFIHLQRPLTEKVQLSFIIIGSGYTASDTSEIIYMRGTAGTYLKAGISPLEYSFSAYYQFGNNSFGIPVQAYLIAPSLSWQPGLLVISTGLDYISGNPDDANHNNKDRLFSILYGTRHRFYGNMDYFSNMEQSTNSRGLVDLWLSTQYKILSGKIGLDIHRFSLQDDQFKLSDYLGSEVDLSFAQKISQELNVSGGVSIYGSTKYFRDMQSSSSSKRIPAWVWIMADFNINLFGKE